MHKYPNLEEAVVALVGFPLVVLHGVDDQLDVEEAAVAAHGADGRLGVVVDGADDRLGVADLVVVDLAVAAPGVLAADGGLTKNKNTDDRRRS